MIDEASDILMFSCRASMYMKFCSDEIFFDY